MSYEWNGVGKVNVANEVMVISELEGSILVQVKSDSPITGANQVGISFCKNDAPNAPITTDQDTAVTGEATGYNGNAFVLDFPGGGAQQYLNNLPVIPKTVSILPTAGGNTVDATDRDGDGLLYTYDVDEDLCGSIDYNTGKLVLSYPAGKDPNTGGIDADYKYTKAIVALGTLSYRIDNLKRSESIKVYATSKTIPIPLKVVVYGGA